MFLCPLYPRLRVFVSTDSAGILNVEVYSITVHSSNLSYKGVGQ